ncbi:MAG: hypothetical protein WCI18_12785 [Pseudomonadota bacterium]
MNKSKKRILITLCSFLGLSGCELFTNNKSKCQWYAMPEADNKEKVDEGYIPICVRNYVTNKQNCQLQATLELAESVYQKAFRYDDLQIDMEGRFPRKIIKVKEFCTPSPEAAR